jgi:sRNA-binding regulator protein Hfq
MNQEERRDFVSAFSTSQTKPAGLFLIFSPWRVVPMSIHAAIVPPFAHQRGLEPGQTNGRDAQSNGNRLRSSQLRARKAFPMPIAFQFPATSAIEEGAYRQAELFYLQKQIQSQTPMVIVLEDGEHVEGCIEWYDRHCLKVRGRSKTLVYKSAIKYMYKLGEAG